MADVGRREGGNEKFNYRQSKRRKGKYGEGERETEMRQNNLWKWGNESPPSPQCFHLQDLRNSLLPSLLLAGRCDNIQIYLSVSIYLLPSCELLLGIRFGASCPPPPPLVSSTSLTPGAIHSQVCPPQPTLSGLAGGAVRQECQFAGREGDTARRQEGETMR